MIISCAWKATLSYSANELHFIKALLVSLLVITLVTSSGAALLSVATQIRADTTQDGENLAALFDPIVAEQMEKLHIPGAVIVIVRDGRIAFTKGYGYANLETKTPVSPERTIFRIGSITKVFTATAVMQLADRGRVDLRTDVNNYLRSAKVPSTYSQPITAADLLTHTSGLDEIAPGRRTGDKNKLIPLGTFLKPRLVRILPPGKAIFYSTYNAALAGLLVEDLTQQSLGMYLRRNVFDVLGMDHSSMGAVRDEYRDDLASGYEYDGKNYEKLPFQWFHTYPASDINTTATDMARFMMAQLQGGAIGRRRILSARATRDMQSMHFRNHPRISGWAYGFYEDEQNGLRIVEHGGSMDDGYSALLTLIPNRGIGLFAACNTEGGAFGLGEAVKKALIDRVAPFDPSRVSAVPLTAQSLEGLKRFANKYRGIIYCHTCPADSGAYVPEPFEVTANADGTLSFRDERWRQVEPLLFVAVTGPNAGKALLGFRENSQGEIEFMFQKNYRVYERVAR